MIIDEPRFTISNRLIAGFSEARKKLQRIQLLHGPALDGIESIIFFPMIDFLLQPLAVDKRQIGAPQYMRWVGELLQ